MAFDFAVRPPEINSALMYNGPGAGPMTAAAATWNNLAAELSTAAASYESVISELSGDWTGTASSAMASTGRGGFGSSGLSTPRYGVKPTVMPTRVLV